MFRCFLWEDKFEKIQKNEPLNLDSWIIDKVPDVLEYVHMKLPAIALFRIFKNKGYFKNAKFKKELYKISSSRILYLGNTE